MIRPDVWEDERPRIAVGPSGGWAAAFALDAIRDGGGVPVDLGEAADGLVWVSPRHLKELSATLARQPGLRWVQLPFAGVERQVSAGLIDTDRTWTCAKGCYARPVAEHALTLALAGLRLIPERARATSWGKEGGRSLYGAKVAIVGGGGITSELLGLLAPFGVDATVVRRRPEPVEKATAVVTTDRIDEALEGSAVVFLALALTPATHHIINRRRLKLIGPNGWLVNVARGGHIRTDDLVEALRAGELGGAALDVTDPEPLPDGHPLWTLPNCLITPHTADTQEMVRPLLAERIRDNVRRFAAGLPLVGIVDPEAGY